ncbi:DUF6263 family protein [Nocardioides dongxiaopingii]|uniref:DUF6263 family protein n=1 Tax=Nocardioides dongxiaopingii TaxID=2576036 RepID=UPI0010C7671F|nr:DUF6263 family protein [Nocardioides dongxiaopingii]
MKRPLAVLCVASLVPLLAACGDDPEPGDGPVVEVQEQGAEPRARLVIDVEVGHTETTVMTLDQDVDAGQSVDVPPIEMTLTNEVVSVDGDAIRVDTTYGESRVVDQDDPAAADIEAALSELTGVTGSTTFTPSGEVTDSEIDIPDGVTSTVRQSMEQLTDQSSSLTVAFPEEELGAGATWTASSALELNGIEVQQTTSYELVSLEGDQYVIEVEVTQEFEPGEAEGFEVVSGDGTSTGTMRGTVGNLTASEVTTSGRTDIRVEAGGQEQTVSTETEMTVRTTVD